jgi:hypothetical protein
VKTLKSAVIRDDVCCHAGTPRRWWTSACLAGLLLMVATAGKGIGQPAPQASKSLEEMSVEELQQLSTASLAREQALMAAIKQERARVEWYLTFVDQILQMQRFLGEDGGRDPGQTLMATGQRIYYYSFSLQEWNALIADHQAVTTRYFQRVGQWAANNPAFVQQLQAAWQQYGWKIVQSQDVTNELLAANQVLAWASGYPSIVPALDHFQGTRQRVAVALAAIGQSS